MHLKLCTPRRNQYSPEFGFQPEMIGCYLSLNQSVGVLLGVNFKNSRESINLNTNPSVD